MIFRAFDEMTSALPAVFWSRSGPKDAAKQLAQEAQRGEKQEKRIRCRVDGNNVVLWRHRPFTRNPFAPIFAGSVREAKDGAQLVGEFRYRKIVLLLYGASYFILLPGVPFILVVTPFMAVWLGASLLGGILAGMVSALFLIGILFAEAILMRLCAYAAKQDKKLIAEHIDGIFQQGTA